MPRQIVSPSRDKIPPSNGYAIVAVGGFQSPVVGDYQGCLTRSWAAASFHIAHCPRPVRKVLWCSLRWRAIGGQSWRSIAPRSLEVAAAAGTKVSWCQRTWLAAEHSLYANAISVNVVGNAMQPAHTYC